MQLRNIIQSDKMYLQFSVYKIQKQNCKFHEYVICLKNFAIFFRKIVKFEKTRENWSYKLFSLSLEFRN